MLAVNPIMQWKGIFVFLVAVLAVGFSLGMVGSYRDADANDEGVQNALNYALVKHNQRSNDLFLSQVAEVVKVETQVVSGVNYRITVKLAKSNCRKGSANQECDTQTDPALARPYECTFTVYSRPWESFINLTNEKCNNN